MSLMVPSKKLMYSIIVFHVVALSLSAQHFKGGLLGGINASQVDGDTHAGYNKVGLMAGAFVYYPLSPAFDLQMEIKYMGKGAHKKSTEKNPIQYKSKLNYIEVPLVLRFNSKQKISWEGGFGFGYLFSYSEEDEYGQLPDADAIKFRSFELSWLLGVNYNFASRWSVNVRFSYSIQPIFNSEITEAYVKSGRGYNNLFSTGIYYQLGK